jgi:hypothetical protein
LEVQTPKLLNLQLGEPGVEKSVGDTRHLRDVLDVTQTGEDYSRECFNLVADRVVLFRLDYRGGSMAVTSASELERHLRDRTHEEGGELRITCEQALALAQELGIPPATLGELCDELGIKIRNCQLHCF